MIETLVTFDYVDIEIWSRSENSSATFPIAASINNEHFSSLFTQIFLFLKKNLPQVLVPIIAYLECQKRKVKINVKWRKLKQETDNPSIFYPQLQIHYIDNRAVEILSVSQKSCWKTRKSVPTI